MEKDLKEIENLIDDIENVEKVTISNLLATFLKTNLKRSKVDNYIGDYPTFIEPVYLEKNVKIGDDVLLGPNTYIGANSTIGNYAEISNTIIFDNVTIGENFKIDNCIIGKGSNFAFTNLNVKNSILKGSVTSEDDLQKFTF